MHTSTFCNQDPGSISRSLLQIAVDLILPSAMTPCLRVVMALPHGAQKAMTSGAARPAVSLPVKDKAFML